MEVENSSGAASGVKAKGGKPLVTLDADIFKDVEVTLNVTLGQGMITVRDLLALTEGSAIELDTPLDGLVDVMLNGRLVAKGEIVAVGDRFGVRIAQIAAEKP